mmetsp:Transcript_17934/g.38196  ORF Transcript_17934/g.38196 Transcript_17934/m.38196 type:complete len:526 (+) Transcript_17934:46-1623(+)
MGAQRPSWAPGNAATNVTDVIEALGFGLAQVRIVLFAHGVWFTDGIDMCVVAMCTPTWISEFNLSHSQAGLFTTVTFIGIGFGAAFSSLPGDSFGRRVPIVACYFATMVMCILTVMSESHVTLLLCRLGMGFAMGLGMSPSLALGSESCPDSWKMAMVACKGAFAFIGMIVGNLFAMLLDPTLMHVDWRKIYLWCTIPSTVLSATSVLFLPESAKFLAQIGDHAGAARALKSMRSLNFRPSISIEYSRNVVNASNVESGTATSAGSLAYITNQELDNKPVPMKKQLKVIFGKSLWGLTIAAILGNVGINLIQYHNNYGEPEVLTRAHSMSHHHSATKPAVQLLVASFWGLLGFPLTIIVGHFFQRKTGLIISFFFISLVTFIFGATAALPDRDHWILKALFQFSLCGSRVIFAAAWNFVHQFSVEFYPAPISTTGGAIAIAVGRVGSILAPLVFEWISTATTCTTLSFYVMAAFGFAVILFIWWRVPTFNKDLATLSAQAEEEVANLMCGKSLSSAVLLKPDKAE